MQVTDPKAKLHLQVQENHVTISEAGFTQAPLKQDLCHILGHHRKWEDRPPLHHSTPTLATYSQILIQTKCDPTKNVRDKIGLPSSIRTSDASSISKWWPTSSMTVSSAVSGLVTTVDMLRPDAIDQLRSLMSQPATRSRSYKMRVLTRTAIYTFEAYASAPMVHTLLQVQRTSKSGYKPAHSIIIIPSGDLLIFKLKVWDIPSRQIRHSFAGHEQDIYSLDFARNGHMIASGSGDHTVRVWDMDRNRNGEILSLTIEDGVTTVAISPNGDYVAAGSLDKSVRVWDIRTGNVIARLDGPEGHKDSVYSVAFSPDGESLVSGSLDKTIKMWQLAPDSRGMMGGQLTRGGRCIRTFEGHKVRFPLTNLCVVR